MRSTITTAERIASSQSRTVPFLFCLSLCIRIRRLRQVRTASVADTIRDSKGDFNRDDLCRILLSALSASSSRLVFFRGW